MPCQYFDCGWCYAPEDAETTAEAGACARMHECPQSVSWPETNIPPVNLNNSLSADNFYPDDEAPPNGMKQRDSYDNNQDS